MGAGAPVPGPGEIVASKYRVERVLGSGGMGIVVAAHHLQLGTKVAIKFLLPGTLKDSDAVARFSREARTAVQIVNEHVARVFDVGTLDTGAPFTVMEFLEGTDLATRLRELGQLTFEEALEDVLQVCEALAEAHALGIVHRDLKPANLFCIRRPDGLPWIKVLDFGISKFVGGTSASQAGITKSATVIGSPLYMSPEQMRSSRDVDARADIWALGIILYELIAGQTPFQGESLPEVVLNVATLPVPNIRHSRPDCPGSLEQAIYKCLEKDRDARFASVADLAIALVSLAPERARASVERITRTAQRGMSLTRTNPRSVPPARETPFAVPTETFSALGQTTPGSKSARRSLRAVLGGAIGLAILPVAGAILVSRLRTEAATASRPGAASSLPNSAVAIPTANPVADPSASSARPPVSGPTPSASAPASAAPASTRRVPEPAPRPNPGSGPTVSKPSPPRPSTTTPPTKAHEDIF